MFMVLFSTGFCLIRRFQAKKALVQEIYEEEEKDIKDAAFAGYDLPDSKRGKSLDFGTIGRRNADEKSPEYIESDDVLPVVVKREKKNEGDGYGGDRTTAYF